MAELAGNDGHLIEAEPVIDRDGDLYTVPGLDWTWADLEPVSSEDRKFVVILPTQRPLPVAEGAVVWLAGRNFFTDVIRALPGTEETRRLGAWAVQGRGYRWYLGQRRAFDEFGRSLGTQLQSALTTALVRGGHEQANVPSMVRLYSVIRQVDPRDRAIHLGLYFQESGDLYSYEFTRTQARVEGVFRTSWGFDRAVRALRETVLTETLHKRFVDSQQELEVRARIAQTYQHDFIARYVARGYTDNADVPEVLKRVLDAGWVPRYRLPLISDPEGTDDRRVH